MDVIVPAMLGIAALLVVYAITSASRWVKRKQRQQLLRKV